MHTDRNAIFSLVASGRITPREAERLLAVSRDGEDSVMLGFCCDAVAPDRKCRDSCGTDSCHAVAGSRAIAAVAWENRLER
jgi:hypothetical protein